ncbi:MAG: sulfurtransferase TusA family protein [Candidatus Krumholzibacteria bacterium]|nr:sulfurtransferase TusA family protein [Candidatus Krumholzibacteria bacterium]
MSEGAPRVVVDTRGLFCPVPIIRTSEAMRNLASGGVVELISDDPAIAHDLPAWCKASGHTIVSSHRKAEDYHYLVRKREGV